MGRREREKSVVSEIVKERLSGDCHKKVGSTCLE